MNILVRIVSCAVLLGIFTSNYCMMEVAKMPLALAANMSPEDIFKLMTAWTQTEEGKKAIVAASQRSATTGLTYAIPLAKLAWSLGFNSMTSLGVTGGLLLTTTAFSFRAWQQARANGKKIDANGKKLDNLNREMNENKRLVQGVQTSIGELKEDVTFNTQEVQGTRRAVDSLAEDMKQRHEKLNETVKLVGKEAEEIKKNLEKLRDDSNTNHKEVHKGITDLQGQVNLYGTSLNIALANQNELKSEIGKVKLSVGEVVDSLKASDERQEKRQEQNRQHFSDMLSGFSQQMLNSINEKFEEEKKERQGDTQKVIKRMEDLIAVNGGKIDGIQQTVGQLQTGQIEQKQEFAKLTENVKSWRAWHEQQEQKSAQDLTHVAGQLRSSFSEHMEKIEKGTQILQKGQEQQSKLLGEVTAKVDDVENKLDSATSLLENISQEQRHLNKEVQQGAKEVNSLKSSVNFMITELQKHNIIPRRDTISLAILGVGGSIALASNGSESNKINSKHINVQSFLQRKRENTSYSKQSTKRKGKQFKHSRKQYLNNNSATANGGLSIAAVD